MQRLPRWDLQPHCTGCSSKFGEIEAMGGGPSGTTSGGANGGSNGQHGASCGCCRAYDGSPSNRLVSILPAGGIAYEGHKGGGRVDNHWDWGTGGGAGAGGDGHGAYGYAGGNSQCGGHSMSTAVAGGEGVYIASFANFGESGWFAGGQRGGQGICKNRNGSARSIISARLLLALMPCPCSPLRACTHAHMHTCTCTRAQGCTRFVHVRVHVNFWSWTM